MNEGGWVGVAGLFVAGLFAWLNKRDSLRHDSELQSLKTQNATQAAQIAEVKADTTRCKDEHAETKAELKDCHGKHEITDARIAALEARIGPK
ncbi:hypothetical protein [Frigoriglobus tundricola]|uniref:Uncharacterized protein n=1 Tax=Frigoriglobus tundricola TaxID=2774151 RepID=A0A6M5YXI8_9BACT|nr:hypothetical protein [Frigoriglobus tundricola]QJW98719.1 hypothetical protein FTUN_6314 [Frigoriglobus tundricola]